MRVVFSPSLSALKPDAASKNLAKTAKANKAKLNAHKAEPTTAVEKFKKWSFSWRRVHAKVLQSKVAATRAAWKPRIEFLVKYLDKKLALKSLKPEFREWYQDERNLYHKEAVELGKKAPTATAAKLANFRLRRPKAAAVKVDNTKVPVKNVRGTLKEGDEKKVIAKKPTAAKTATTTKVPALKDASEKMKPLIRKYRELRKAVADAPEKTAAQKKKKEALELELKKAGIALKRRIKYEEVNGKPSADDATKKRQRRTSKPRAEDTVNKDSGDEEETDTGDEEESGGDVGSTPAKPASKLEAVVKAKQDSAAREKESRSTKYRSGRDSAIKEAWKMNVNGGGDKSLSRYDGKTLRAATDMLHNLIPNVGKKRFVPGVLDSRFEKLGIKPEHIESIYNALKPVASGLQNGLHK